MDQKLEFLARRRAGAIALVLCGLLISTLSCGGRAFAQVRNPFGHAQGLAAPTPARAFKIRVVWTGHYGSDDPAIARAPGEDSSEPSRSGEPFGRIAFGAPEGDLKAKWRQLREALRSEAQVTLRCRAAAARCGSPAAMRFIAMAEDMGRTEGLVRLETVNRLVNTAIRYASDIAQHGSPDHWSAPLASLATGRGDCEDYAILKNALLRYSGVPGEDLRLLFVRDAGVRQDHAVLAVRHDGRWLLLDNRQTPIVEDVEAPTLVPLFAIDHQGVTTVAMPYAASPDVDARPRGVAARDSGPPG